MVQTAASMLRSIATPFHDSMRSRIRRHRKPAKEPPNKDQQNDELAKLVNGDAKDAGRTKLLGKRENERQRQTRAITATTKGKRFIMLLFAASVCLFTTRKALELANVIEEPSESSSAMPATSRRKRMRDGSGPTNSRDSFTKTAQLGWSQNNTMTLESDPSKPNHVLLDSH